MKYKDENGNWQEIYLPPTGDTIPIGAEVDIPDDVSVPSGWQEVSPIIESGSNEKGNYVKYADGTMIQYGLITITSEITTSAGALYRMPSTGKQLFPKSFANTNIAITMTSRTDNVPFCNAPWFSTSGFSFQTYSYTSIGSGTRLFFWQAIGRWK